MDSFQSSRQESSFSAMESLFDYYFTFLGTVNYCNTRTRGRLGGGGTARKKGKLSKILQNCEGEAEMRAVFKRCL